jgi:2-polyprenyl-3-methyl-5-hydroxy-6-metoxy-1,4-benzoquinol methylase
MEKAQGTRRKAQRTSRAVAMAALVALSSAAVSAQLAGRPAEEWQKTLEAPARVDGLKIAEVVAAMRLRPTDVVADLGAGTGLFEVALARAVPSGRVYAVELDEKFFPHIQAKLTAAAVTNVSIVTGKFTDPSLPARDVDVAFFHDVLHHVENRAEYLRNLTGYLKPGARIVVVEYQAADSPHKVEPALVVGKDQGAQLMAGIGFKPTEDHALFTDKWFVGYTRR